MSIFDRFLRSSAPSELSFDEQRQWMIEHQLREWGIHDSKVLEVMAAVPRELFVPEDERDAAYYDGALPIGEGQTISQPFVVAHMTELLALHGDEKVLEIGTGSGYQAAVLSHLAQEVHTVERLASLARRAEATLASLGIPNVYVHVGDGSKGWPDQAPYHAIIVTCASPGLPSPLVEQLADGGRMVIPVGPRGLQDLVLVWKVGNTVKQEKRAPVAFVPLIGEHGW